MHVPLQGADGTDIVGARASGHFYAGLHIAVLCNLLLPFLILCVFATLACATLDHCPLPAWIIPGCSPDGGALLCVNSSIICRKLCFLVLSFARCAVFTAASVACVHDLQLQHTNSAGCDWLYKESQCAHQFRRQRQQA